MVLEYKGVKPEMRLDMEEQLKQEYQEYVKEVTPTHNLWLQMAKAFLVGGIICVIGQLILNYCTKTMGLDKETAGSWSFAAADPGKHRTDRVQSISFCREIRRGGRSCADYGFANLVAAPAIEFKKEGQVFGIGCKIFTIAGPVILYGIFTSWVLGLGYWIGKCLGWF